MLNSTQLLVDLHGAIGPGPFLVFSIVVSVVLSFVAIPMATGHMVNSAAGLAGKHFGPTWRTLCINASTNNPEAFSMLLSFGMRRMGGWSNPLGSLLANIYLMYILGVLYVMAKFAVLRDFDRLRRLIALMKTEWRLFAGHVAISFFLFLVGYGALRTMLSKGDTPTVGPLTLVALGLLVVGIVAFVVFEWRLKRKRGELFRDISDEDFRASWPGFLGGTAGVILSCWLMNALFLGWSVIYETSLTKIFGAMIFAWLHYFVGSVITSLPELFVTVKNLEKLRPADFNTALGSVSYSNMVNLAIAVLGLLLWALFSSLGVSFSWS
ncbi:MAG: hypothetical protein KF858_06895 [Candidatus Sumerlaeia bacterium]|nr:hypothetical protein [Candidatus Sumerlaeia bacterium]